MRRYSETAWERAMKVQEVILRATVSAQYMTHTRGIGTVADYTGDMHARRIVRLTVGAGRFSFPMLPRWRVGLLANRHFLHA
jgi:hypothetical protein